MLFTQFAKYLQKLDQTSSRLQMTAILAELFQQASKEEIGQLCYLSLGILAPKYEGIEFSMAEKLIVRAIARAVNKSENEAMTEFKKSGDLGLVIDKLKCHPPAGGSNVKTSLSEVKTKTQMSNLSVVEVYQKLLTIAQEERQGSVKRKINKMAILLSEMDALSAKYVVRIVLEKLRLGFSDMTILDALSWMFKRDKSLRPELERAFNVLADIGKIAQVFKKEGIKGIKSIKSEVGVPIRPAKAERLPDPEKILEKMKGQCTLEPKYDGFRCIGGYTGLYIKQRGFISAKDVKKGDYVLGMSGVFKKIIAKHQRIIDKKERYFELQSFLGNKFYITEGHKVLCWHQGKEQWLPVEQINKNSYFIFPIPKIKTKSIASELALATNSGYTKIIKLDKKFFRFIGFWIGDGFTNNYHNTERIGLCFNAKTERNLCSFYKKMICKIFQINKISQEERNGALIIYWRDQPFRQWLTEHFRREWRGKVLPPWFAGISQENFEEFINGWIESDGKQTIHGGYKITTKEKDLAAFAQLIALGFKKIVGLRRIRQKISNYNFVGTYYELIFPKTLKYISIKNDKLMIKVLHKNEIKDRDPRKIVYNFHVEDDESYATSLVVLHNCQIHLNKAKSIHQLADRKAISNDKNLELFGDKKSKKEYFVRIFSRNMDNTTEMFPEIVEAVKQLPVKSVILDGEAIAYNPHTGKFLPFQETVQRKRKHDVAEKSKELPLKAFVFDVLYLNGESLISQPFSERRHKLAQILSKSTNKTILLTLQKQVSQPQEFKSFFNKVVNEGLEGLMAKKLDAPYRAGARDFTWVKYKAGMKSELADTIDCVVMGYYRGEGKRTGFGIGAFLVGIINEVSEVPNVSKVSEVNNGKFLTVSKIGTGLTDEQWREMKMRCKKWEVREKPKEYIVDKNLFPDVWCQPKIVVEIEADMITRSPIHTAGLALRFPRLKRFRDDKNPQEATSLKELQLLSKIKMKSK